MALDLRVDGWGGAGPIPARFTCDGDDVSPAVAWAGVPAAARSLVLALVDDDASGGAFVHWLLFNLPPFFDAIPERAEALPDGAQEGTTGFGRTGYGGPCPPPGETHRYRFELYALDRRLKLGEGVAMRHVREAMRGRVLDEAAVTGVYGRSARRRAAAEAGAGA